MAIMSRKGSYLYPLCTIDQIYLSQGLIAVERILNTELGFQAVNASVKVSTCSTTLMKIYTASTL